MEMGNNIASGGGGGENIIFLRGGEKWFLNPYINP